MGNLSFIIDGQKADVSENVDFTRIYRGSETVDTKKNNYSLTVKFPFTYNNELIFKRTNSLSYKSAFPYQLHEVDAISDGVVVIRKAKLVLLATTDSFECSLTWDNVDLVNNVLNNTTKLGVLLASFPELRWDYQYSENRDDNDYDTTKADTYGFIKYNHQTGTVGSQHFSTFNHPVINFKYLLDLIFTELGLTLSIPTPKNDYLQSLIIRPNKELDRKSNNMITALLAPIK